MYSYAGLSNDNNIRSNKRGSPPYTKEGLLALS